MKIMFLGTSSMVPTKERNAISILLRHGSEGILVDCGEGTQRQLKIAGIKPTIVTKILITHWHGDHVLGLPGLIQTLGNSEYNKKLEIFGPAGSAKIMDNVFKTFISEKRIEIKVNEVRKKRFYIGEDFYLEALPLKHKITTLGYSFIEKDKRKINLNYIKKIGIPQGPLLGKLQEGKTIIYKKNKIMLEKATYLIKGRKVSFVLDTLPCQNGVTLAKNADLLISEATYTSDLEEKAREYKHLTAIQAAMIANQACAKKLILTHFSQRYKITKELLEEAKNIFPNTKCAYDFMKVEL